MSAMWEVMLSKNVEGGDGLRVDTEDFLGNMISGTDTN